MPGFVYFLPNTPAADCKVEKLRALGLGYAFEDRTTAAMVTSGPDGARGHVVGDPRLVPENQLGYFPTRQRWQKIPAGLPGHEAQAWVGMPSEGLLAPQDVAREQQLAGHWVRLADGQKWLAPVARKTLATEEQPLRYAVTLPHVAGIDAEGQWSATCVLARYEPLWAVAMRFWDALLFAEIDDESAQLEFADLLDAAVLTLAANYRIGKLEASLLGILTTQHAYQLLQALVDWPVMADWLKKKLSTDAGLNTESGPAGEILTTSPPAPTSGPSPNA